MSSRQGKNDCREKLILRLQEPRSFIQISPQNQAIIGLFKKVNIEDMPNKFSVGIIDDHHLFRSGIAEIVDDTAKYKIVISVSNSGDLFEALKKTRIEILLLDIRLKGEDGLDILERMKIDYPDVRVIMLTMHNEASYINTFIQAGAQGYLTKDTTPEELVETLDKVIEHGKYFNTQTTNALVDALQNNAKLAKSGMDLTDLETDILIYISQGKTAEEISNLLFKSTRTIEGYRQKLLLKTKSKNIAELVAWGYKSGVLA